jgi:hypothetical protein
MKSKLITAFFLFLALALLMPSSAFAYAGVTGSVLDSKTSQPWVYGGDVWVLNVANGDIVATGALSASGTFSIAYGDDDLGVGSLGSAPVSGNQVKIIIDFTCSQSVDCGGLGPAPNGNPGNSEFNYTEAPIPGYLHAGYIKTGTGPTAIKLESLTVSPAGSTSTSWLALVVCSLILTVYFFWRRRQSSQTAAQEVSSLL